MPLMICRYLLILVIVVFCCPCQLMASHDMPSDFFSKGNRTYSIKKEYDLGGKMISIPAEVTIKFKRKGKLKNGGLVGNGTVILSDDRVRFDDDFKFSGTFDSDFEYEWFYDSSCELVDTTIHVYGRNYKVKTARGENQWDNVRTIFKRLNNAFPGLRFNKSYVLNNPSGETGTSSNIVQITDKVTDLVISGGTFYNAGFAFYDWNNIVIRDMSIVGRYHDYASNAIDWSWAEFHKENGQSLCYNSVGIHLTSSMFSSAVNEGATIDNVCIKNCYNGIYIGRWTGQDLKLRSVRNVEVKNCKVYDVVYHSYCTCNCDNVVFNNNYARNSYLGMLVDISRGSSRVLFKNSIGEGFPQPFKIANNEDYAPTVDCLIDSCNVSIVSILRECTVGPSIQMSGEGICQISGCGIFYEDNFEGTLLSLGGIPNSRYIVKNNHIYSSPLYSFVRLTTSKNIPASVNVLIQNNTIENSYTGEILYGLILDDLRQNDNAVDISISILDNLIVDQNKNAPQFKLLQVQGYNRKNIRGDIILKNNIVPYRLDSQIIMVNDTTKQVKFGR